MLIKSREMYQERTYRGWVRADELVKFEVCEKETDLLILAERDLSKEAQDCVHKYRIQLEDFIIKHPDFKDTLEPWDVKEPKAPIVEEMIKAARLAGVGPMAAVAGAVAEFVGRDLLKHSKEVIIENGGDIFLATRKPRTFGIFAGNSPLTGKLAFEIIPSTEYLGVCTSSGTVGHSLSFGKADAAVIIARNAALSDAVATACGNLAKTKDDIEKSINFARSIPDVLGVIIIIGDKFGSWGRVGFKWSLKS